MAYHIRPLSFAELLDRALRVLVDHFALMAGIMAMVWVPYNAMLVVGRSTYTMNLVAMFLLPIGNWLVSAVLFAAVAKVYIGEPTGFRDAVDDVRPIVWKVFGTAILTFLLCALAFIALILPEVYFAVCWCLVGPVMIIERRFGMAALGRSRQLVRGVWWQAFAIMFLPGFFVGAVPSLVTRLLWSSFPFFGPIISAAVQTVVAAYIRTLVVVYYFDRRCRTEDFDLRLLAEQIRAEGGDPTRTAAPTAA